MPSRGVEREITLDILDVGVLSTIVFYVITMPYS